MNAIDQLAAFAIAAALLGMLLMFLGFAMSKPPPECVRCGYPMLLAEREIDPATDKPICDTCARIRRMQREV